jgi:(S)-2-hydroxyglutarate dehydrogenase
LHPDGRLADDFVVVDTPRTLHVLNAPSPAATASLAIGRSLGDRLADRLAR